MGRNRIDFARFEAPEAEAAKAAAILQEEMEGCVNYAVPLSTEVHQGKNWLEAH